MKKIITVLAFIGCLTMSAFAHEPVRSMAPTDEQPVTVTVLSVSNSAIELLVEANNVVYDVCNYFNGSWLDVGIALYCKFGGDVYTCTAYKITKIACAVSGAVKLYIEGDISNATKKALLTGADIWKMTRAGEKKVELSPSNMCPAN